MDSERVRRLLTRNPFPLESPGALGYSPVAFRILSASLPDLTIRKKIVAESKDGMGLSCLLLREAVAL